MLTPEQAKVRNKYLLKNYELTSFEYDVMLLEQGGVCKICGRPPKTVPLNVDHDHSYRYFRVTFEKLADKSWRAVCPKLGLEAVATLRGAAIKLVRRKMLRASVRGLLCTFCNPGLQKFQDDPVRMRAGAAYLEAFTSKATGSTT